MSPWQLRVFSAAVQAHQQSRLAHALLFAGPAHLGKREVAEALAKRILCGAPIPEGAACGECRSCQLFAAQTIGLVTTHAHPDLQRIGLEPNEKGDKLRSEISVDQIRRLSQWFSLTPQMGRAQVAIIEPADLMNASAANALLKTLEEPSNNRFLLIGTSRPGRLPATIRSRCQRLEFSLPPAHEALEWLGAQGMSAAEAATALAAARGNPGLAARWRESGGLGLRAEVAQQLNAVGSGRLNPIETAQRWLADDSGELRMRFAADLALDAVAGVHGAPREVGSLTPPGDVSGIPDWFDAINRTREQLRAPLRNDLVLAGLLQRWRTMFENGQ